MPIKERTGTDLDNLCAFPPLGCLFNLRAESAF